MQTQTKLQKIQKMSTILRAICTGLLVLIALLGVSSVVCLAFGVGGVTFDGTRVGTVGLAFGHRLILGAVCALALGALYNCFYRLRRLFGNYSRGQIFTRESVGEMRQFGIACLLWGVMTFFWGLSLVMLVHTVKSFQGHGDSLVLGVILIAIAWFMEMAVELREENELTI